METDQDPDCDHMLFVVPLERTSRWGCHPGTGTARGSQPHRNPVSTAESQVSSPEPGVRF